MVVQKKHLARISSLCEDTVSNAAHYISWNRFKGSSDTLIAISNMFYVLVEWPTLSSK